MAPLFLHNLKPAVGSKKTPKRVGRGAGSGSGKTSGRGSNGQRARNTVARGFEGGQMPLIRRLPKRGFKNINKILFRVCNLDQLSVFAAGQEVGEKEMIAESIINHKGGPVKLLARGEIDRALTLTVSKASTTAIEKIEKAGGKVNLI